MFEILTGSIGAIAGVTTVLRNLEAQSGQETTRNILHSINEIKNRLNILTSEISRRPCPWSKADEAILISQYNSLLEILRANRHYSSHLELQPTDYGTWKVVRIPKRERKSTILRDPEGEYKDTFEEAAEVNNEF